jgi:hypothetical protein
MIKRLNKPNNERFEYDYNWLHKLKRYSVRLRAHLVGPKSPTNNNKTNNKLKKKKKKQKDKYYPETPE